MTDIPNWTLIIGAVVFLLVLAGCGNAGDWLSDDRGYDLWLAVGYSDTN